MVANVQDFGAVPDGRDCVEAFNDAVEAVGQNGGGAILIPAGTYVLSGPIWMHWSDVVLRGADMDTAILHFTRPLNQSYGSFRSWNEAGGQIMMIPKARRDSWELGDPPPQFWVFGDVLAEVGTASRGQRTLVVSDTSEISDGDMVLLEWDSPNDAGWLQHIAGDVPAASAYDWQTHATGNPAALLDTANYGTPWWPVRVEAVLDERLVRLAQPLKFDLRPGWPAVLRDIGPTVHDSGIERLTVRNEVIPQTSHNTHPGSNGLYFRAAHDCWAREVRVENADVGFSIRAGKSITLTDVCVGGRAAHHSYTVAVHSHDNLVEDFVIEQFDPPLASGATHHGLSLGQLSSGNVFRRGQMTEGTFDWHKGMAFENVITDVTVNNIGRSGGAVFQGPRLGARNVVWNVRVLANTWGGINIGIDGVAPRGLALGVQGLTDPQHLGINLDFRAGDLYPNGQTETFNVQWDEEPAVADLYAAQREDA